MNKPNILMIVCDQLRYDCVGYAGIRPIKTPNVDRLAARGMRFLNAYTPIPTCCPARQSLLSGRRPESFGALWNYDITLPIPALEPNEYTFPRELFENGYQTAYIGKWHVHPVKTPIDYGFDIYSSENDYYRFRCEKHPDSEFTGGWLGEADAVPLFDTKTHFMARKAAEQIEAFSKGSQPWHIRLDFSEPHLPCTPREEFLHLYNPDTIPQWGSFYDTFEDKPYIQKQNIVSWGLDAMTWDDWKDVVTRYYAIVSQMDDAVGMVLDMLDENELWNDTVVIFTADHGDMCGSHRMIDKHVVMYDDVVRVPMVVYWPEVTEPGSVSDKYVYPFLDIPPTILEACDLAPPSFFHGRSTARILRGRPEPDWRDSIMSTYNGQQFGLYCERMLVMGGFKYIWNMTDVDELYDMEHDRDELHNLIHNTNYAVILSTLRHRLYDELKAVGDGILRTGYVDSQLLQGRKI